MNERTEQSDDPEYLAWKDVKITAALRAARTEPEHRVSQAEVWARYGGQRFQ